jgi:small-conductance mechanosensitive channel
VSVLLDKPFGRGDFIIVGDTLGSVEKIGLKTAHVRSLWGEQVVISNGDLLASRIRNYTRFEADGIEFAFPTRTLYVRQEKREAAAWATARPTSRPPG